WFDGRSISAARLRENGFDPEAPLTRLWVELTHQLIGFPRHLSQHPGGFVIARDQIEQLVPVENAAMPERSVVQWDKDDLDTLGLIKVDVLALGMLSALRRAMAAWKRRGGLGPFEDRLVGRMVEKGYAREYAERIFKQIQGFGEYGFPESHAAGFALLAYDSSWIKRHHPDAFLAGLLNSQPMGFYAPAQLVRDAREHGVEVRPVDVRVSAWDSTLEEGEGAALRPVRLGL